MHTVSTCIMLDKIGKYEFVAEPFHCDFSGRMFLGHLGNQMLNAADFHSTDRGFGMKYLMSINRSWVLSRLAIEMTEMPGQHERYTVETWVESAMKFFTNRNFRVSGCDGRVYGYGRSVWAMIDTETRQPTDILKIDNGAINAWIVTDEPCPIEKGGRVKMSDNGAFVRKVDIRYNDIDINGHVNSVKYIEHVLDLWEVAWYREHRLKRFEIAYVAETHEGDTLSFYREHTEENVYDVRLVKKEPSNGTEMEVCRCRVVFCK